MAADRRRSPGRPGSLLETRGNALPATRLASSAVLFLAACASGPKETGIRLGDTTLSQFRVGEATESWVVAVVGPPTSRTDLWDEEKGEHVAILRYVTKEEGSGIGSALGFGGSRTTATVYFVSRDGLITQMWADRATERTLTGQREKQTGEKAAQP